MASVPFFSFFFFKRLIHVSIKKNKKQKQTCKYEGTKVFPGEETIYSTPPRDSDGPNSAGVCPFRGANLKSVFSFAFKNASKSRTCIHTGQDCREGFVEMSPLCIPATHRFPLLEKGNTNENTIQIRWPGASRWLFYRQTSFQEDTG